jgi:hypothetical protein
MGQVWIYIRVLVARAAILVTAVVECIAWSYGNRELHLGMVQS